MKQTQLDLIELFFIDVSKLDAIPGRIGYLPLTRKLRRGNLYAKVNSAEHRITYQKIRIAIRKNSSRLSEVLHYPGEDHRLYNLIAKDVDTFLETPELKIPDSFLHFMPKNTSKDAGTTGDRVETLLWRLLYLLSLLPMSHRTDIEEKKFTREVIKHFRLVDNETRDARQRLLNGTLRYPVTIASLYVSSGIPYLDLVQEGFFGLERALQSFDERKGGHLQSYAATWIHQRLTRYVSDFSRLIRIPVHKLESQRVLSKVAEAFSSRHGRFPNEFEFMLELNWMTNDDFRVLRKRKQLKKQVDNFRSRCDALEELYQNRYKILDSLPIEHQFLVGLLQEKLTEMKAQHGEEPSSLELFVALGWISAQDVEFSQEFKVFDAEIADTLQRYGKAIKELRYYYVANALHYSLESTYDKLPRNDDIEVFSLREDLPDPQDYAQLAESRTIALALESQLEALDPKSQFVLSSRFGLMNRDAKTLEEIGQKLGLTRERVRQIETKAIRQLRHPLRSRKLRDLLSESSTGIEVEYVNSLQRTTILRSLYEYEAQQLIDVNYVYSGQKKVIDKLIRTHLRGGKKRVVNTRSRTGRSHLLAGVLASAGQPLHYSVIHERAMEMLPEILHFSKSSTYATMFYNDQFRLMGKGTFGLADWNDSSRDDLGERVFRTCPSPLLPETYDPRGFFESIMVGREILKRKSSTDASLFWSEMLQWSRSTNENNQQIQPAFDAWYSVGLIERIIFDEYDHRALRLTIAPNAPLHEVRLSCLNNLCHRILKMPELLLAMVQLAHPTLSDLQRAVFGGEQAGFDVPTRLLMLESFEAVRKDGTEWHLTSLGQSLLENNPPQELPDFSEMLMADQPDHAPLEIEVEWDDELGLIE